MALLQISEPGKKALKPERRIAAGIDLGTTNSLIAIWDDGQFNLLADKTGEVLLPSVVRYFPDKSVWVGQQAKLTANEDALNTIHSVKRFLGKGLDDVIDSRDQLLNQFVSSESGALLIKTAVGNVNPVSVSSEILRTLSSRLRQVSEQCINDVVITVPAYFDDSQRQATKDAAALAGLNVLRLLNEPTAAAIAYGLDKSESGVFAVYDLGGGTFDVSILKLKKGVFEVLATAGDTRLGGDDFDFVIANLILRKSKILRQLSPTEMRALLNLSKQVKEALTDDIETTVLVDFVSDYSWQGVISQSEIEIEINPLVEKTVEACLSALKDARVLIEDIEEIVLVGGATRMPVIQRRVEALFGKKPHIDIDPDKVVAQGAAIQADILMGNQSGLDLLLLDVIPLSLGLEMMGGLSEKIIQRNTTIPVVKSKEFTTYKDGQTGMSIHVVQGERELVCDNRSLAKFELLDIPPLVAGAARVNVTFQVDADGLLTVSASELSTNVKTAVEVKPSYGLTDQQVENMIRDSFGQAKHDVEKRQEIELTVDAQAAIESVKSAIDCDGVRLLSQEQLENLKRSVRELEEAVNNGDSLMIKRANVKLEDVSGEFAALRMNENIQKALQGRSIEEI